MPHKYEASWLKQVCIALLILTEFFQLKIRLSSILNICEVGAPPPNTSSAPWVNRVKIGNFAIDVYGSLP